MLRPDQVSADLCGKAQLFHDLLLSPIRLLPGKSRTYFEMHFINAEMTMYFSGTAEKKITAVHSL